MIKNKTIYTKENFLKFQKYHYFYQAKVIRIIFSLFGIFFLILGILGFVFADYMLALIESILGFFLIFEFNTSLIPIFHAKMILKSDSMMIGMENTFVFYEDRVEVINSRSASKIPYQEIYCYREYQDYIYIYLNKVSAFLVDKNGMLEGSSEQLAYLLQEKIKGK